MTEKCLKNSSLLKYWLIQITFKDRSAGSVNQDSFVFFSVVILDN